MTERDDAVETEPTDETQAAELRGHWAKVEEAIATAKAMHFDGCHKIYLSMDETEVETARSAGYDAVTPDMDVIRGWYESSCPLRFISAVHTNVKDPNAGFVRLIPQGY